jgi:hypothetical protein
MTRARDLAKGTFSGDLTVDTNTLVVDSANNNVGIGTSSPSALLHVEAADGAAGGAIKYTSTGVASGYMSADGAGLCLATDTAGITFRTGVTGNDPTDTGTERMRIDSSGIDVTGNATANGNGNVEIKATTTSNAYSYLTMGTWGLDRGQIRVEGANPGSGSGTGSGIMSFWTAQNPTMTEAMRINQYADIQIGTYFTGNTRLSLYGASSAKNGMAIMNSSDAGTIYSIFFNNAAGGTIGSITNNGSATSFNTGSDYRLKEDLQLMSGASERVLALKPINFAWISTGERVDGFLAHELAEVIPEAVVGTKDGMRDEQYEVTAAVLDDNGMVVTEAVMGTRSVPDYQGIDQSKLVPLLTAALQEALNKIEAMETRLAALEAV